MGKRKTTAWQAYCEYYDSSDDSMPEQEFETIVNCLDSYLRDIIKGQVFNCSEFDMDDYMADTGLLLWQRMSSRSLPAHDQGMFVGAIKVVVRRMLIDSFRRSDAAQRAVENYTDKVELVVEDECYATRMWADKLLKKHKDILARTMSMRSRFPVVTQRLARRVVDLFQDNAPLKEVTSVLAFALKKTDAGGSRFLLAYLQILYRWASIDLRTQIREAA